MSRAPARTGAKHHTRPPPERTRPLRKSGGLYRTDDNDKAGLGGFTLTKMEDVAIAGVRMGYGVAASAVARTGTWANRINSGTNRAAGYAEDGGSKGAQDAVDAAERLVSNATLSAMSWVEALVARDDGLAPRLAAAQVRAVKNVLFNRGDERDDEPRAEARAAAQPAPATAFERRAASVDARIVLEDKPEDRRAVTIIRWDLRGPVEGDIVFRVVEGVSAVRLHGRIMRAMADDHRPALVMKPMFEDAPAGEWRAAVCDSKGEQLGIVEIEI